MVTPLCARVCDAVPQVDIGLLDVRDVADGQLHHVLGELDMARPEGVCDCV